MLLGCYWIIQKRVDPFWFSRLVSRTPNISVQKQQQISLYRVLNSMFVWSFRKLHACFELIIIKVTSSIPLLFVKIEKRDFSFTFESCGSSIAKAAVKF